VDVTIFLVFTPFSGKLRMTPFYIQKSKMKGGKEGE